MYKKQAGIGLLEILVSVLIISIGAVGIIGLQNHMRKKSAQAEEYLIAARMGQEGLDDLKTFTPATFNNVVSAADGNILSTATTTSVGGITFTRVVMPAEDVPLVVSGGISTSNQLKEAKVKIQWHSLATEGALVSEVFSTEISPVAAFSSDDYFQDMNDPVSSGPLPTSAPHHSMDPSNAAHIPPDYEYDYPYFMHDQMVFAGEKYKCISEHCKNHSAYGPGTAGFAAAWSLCPGMGACP